MFVVFFLKKQCGYIIEQIGFIWFQTKRFVLCVKYNEYSWRPSTIVLASFKSIYLVRFTRQFYVYEARFVQYNTAIFVNHLEPKQLHI